MTKVVETVWRPKFRVVRLQHRFGWSLEKTSWFSQVFCPIPCDQGKHRSDWKSLISFFGTHLLLCLTLSEMGAEPFCNSYYCVFELEFTTLGQRMDDEMNSCFCWGLSAKLFARSSGIFLALSTSSCSCSSSENIDFWLNPEYRIWQMSSVFSVAGGEQAGSSLLRPLCGQKNVGG